MERLKKYLNGQGKFSWANNNCLKFVSGALEAQDVSPLPPDWYEGFWDTRSGIVHYRKTLSKYNKTDILDALDSLFDREVTLHPRSGWIIGRKSGDLLGYCFGVVFNDQGYFLSEGGLVVTRLQASDLYWRTK